MAGPSPTSSPAAGTPETAAGDATPTREQCIAAAGQLVADHALLIAQMTPREQAEAAWTPTSRKTVDQLEDEIRHQRGLPPVHARAS